MRGSFGNRPARPRVIESCIGASVSDGIGTTATRGPTTASLRSSRSPTSPSGSFAPANHSARTSSSRCRRPGQSSSCTSASPPNSSAGVSARRCSVGPWTKRSRLALPGSGCTPARSIHPRRCRITRRADSEKRERSRHTSCRCRTARQSEHRSGQRLSDPSGLARGLGLSGRRVFS